MKNNAFLARMQAQSDRRAAAARNGTINFMEDVALIAANRYFGAGEKRAWEFLLAMREVEKELAKMTVRDAQEDKDLVYTQEITDRMLRPILGPHFVPYEERMKRGLRE